MKVVVYAQQGKDILSGVYSNIYIDTESITDAILVRLLENDNICHYISCRNIDTMGIWQTNELDEGEFISVCKYGNLAFMIVPDEDKSEESLQDLLNRCIKKIER